MFKNFHAWLNSGLKPDHNNLQPIKILLSNVFTLFLLFTTFIFPPCQQQVITVYRIIFKKINLSYIVSTYYIAVKYWGDILVKKNYMNAAIICQSKYCLLEIWKKFVLEEIQFWRSIKFFVVPFYKILNLIILIKIYCSMY